MNESTRPDIPCIDSRVVSSFITPSLRDESTYEAYHHRSVALIALSLTAFGPVFGLFYWQVLDLPELAVPVFAASLGWLLILQKPFTLEELTAAIEGRVEIG